MFIAAAESYFVSVVRGGIHCKEKISAQKGRHFSRPNISHIEIVLESKLSITGGGIGFK